jgi:hypothetical protein
MTYIYMLPFTKIMPKSQLNSQAFERVVLSAFHTMLIVVITWTSYELEVG